MYCLSRKNHLAKNLIKLRKIYPKDYNFFPRTWALPTELKELKTYAQNKKNRVYIVKPEASC